MIRGAFARRWLLLLPGLVVLAACAARPVPPAPSDSQPSAAATPPLHEGPLTDYLPAAGLRWLVVADLRRLTQAPLFRAGIDRLIPEERFAAYEKATGFDLRTTSQALVAGYSLGTIYLATSNTDNALVEQRFVERMPAGVVRHQAHPQVEVLVGMLGRTPAALVSQQRHLVGVAFGDPTLARIVDAYARGKLGSKTALHGAALSPLADSVHDAPLEFYAPGPFPDQWAAGAGGIMETATAVRIDAAPEGEVLHVRVIVAGDWSEHAVEARGRAERLWEQLAASVTGRLLGFGEPTRPPIFTASSDRIAASVDLALRPLLDGLHAAVAADVRELLDLPPVRPVGPPPPTRDLGSRFESADCQ